MAAVEKQKRALAVEFERVTRRTGRAYLELRSLLTFSHSLPLKELTHLGVLYVLDRWDGGLRRGERLATVPPGPDPRTGMLHPHTVHGLGSPPLHVHRSHSGKITLEDLEDLAEVCLHRSKAYQSYEREAQLQAYCTMALWRGVGASPQAFVDWWVLLCGAGAACTAAVGGR